MDKIYFNSSSEDVNASFRIAMGDLTSNICQHHSGMLKQPENVIIAGLDYVRPWTRDASINTWNCVNFLFPEVAKNTLLAVVDEDESYGVRIVGEYWDSIIWVTGAWNYYINSGDKEMLEFALKVAKNTLKFFEDTEFSSDAGLFRGPACYGDGVAAYPMPYADSGGNPGIEDWVKFHPDEKADKGHGIPMFCLSTNCLYYNAYTIVNKIHKELGMDVEKSWDAKAAKLKFTINEKLWNEDKGCYNYLDGLYGPCDHNEGIGHAFAILFGVADDEEIAKILENQKVTEYGIPCVWPTFDRYQIKPGDYGRHSGTVWPHIQGLWATAALDNERSDLFDLEFNTLTKLSNRDCQFTEIYHPETGEPYGGLQELDGEMASWESCRRQTWSATAYLRMIYQGVAGMKFTAEGVEFKPYMPAGMNSFAIGIPSYHGSTINFKVSGEGSAIESCFINGAAADKPYVPADSPDNYEIEIKLA